MDYKTICIVDPVRGERIQLAKFIMQENFTVMSFVNLEDCLKRSGMLKVDLVIYVLRKGKTEMKALLEKPKSEHKKIPFVIAVNSDSPEVNLNQLKEAGFDSVFKAQHNEKIREITYSLLAPEGLMPRTETPHPIPLP